MEMSNSFTTIVLIIVTAGLILLVPIVTVAARNDIKSNQAMQTAVTDFVNKASETRSHKNKRL